jgi:hypothetical protein
MTTTAYPTDAVIEKVMADRKLEKRVAAVQWLRRHNIVTVEDLAKQQADLAPLNAKLAKVADEKAAARKGKAKPAAKAQVERAAVTEKAMDAINELAASEARKAGKSRILTVFKSSLSPKFAQYVWFGLDNGTVLSVNPATMATRWLDPKSKSCKAWQRQLARSLKREERAAAKDDNEKAKVAQAKAK